jgi:hypothetical protein
LQYYDLNEASCIIIARFENDLKLSRPKQYKAASQIKEILMQHDIFSAEGYCQAINESLKLWGLENLVSLNSYPPRVG